MLHVFVRNELTGFDFAIFKVYFNIQFVINKTMFHSNTEVWEIISCYKQILTLEII